MAKYDVYLYTIVTVKICGVKAEYDEEAMNRAGTAVDLDKLFESVHIPIPTGKSPYVDSVEYSDIDGYFVEAANETDHNRGREYDRIMELVKYEENDDIDANEELTDAQRDMQIELFKMRVDLDLIEIAERQRQGLELTDTQRAKLQMIELSNRWELKQMEALRKRNITYLPHWRKRKKPR
jgi:hypothetical protein